ncbi:alcohol dehydrogenase catalytic domain-containing protein [Candidatus Bathyarchaeota archaeon]|nr:alcohol dehydrogenase catalytic domain-containing protein [Candidatus Bathyarchaeota archaeon]
MKGIVIKSKHDLECTELANPDVSEQEVLVQVKASGICGTDVHVYEGEVPLAKLPVVPGHEFCGVVLETGKNVQDISPGDRVAVEPNLFCGKCHFCRNAKKHFCRNWGAVGLTRDGGFAELAAVPDQAIYKMPDSISYSLGAFFEPLACVLHGIERSGARAGDAVVVQGSGSIGLLFIQALRVMGMRSIFSIDIDDTKLTLARKLGATETINPGKESARDAVMALTDGLGAGIVIDAAGVEQSLNQSFDLVKDTGTIVIFGVPAEKMRLPVKMYDIYRRELRVVGSFTNPYTNEQALNLLSTGRIHVDDIITDIIPLTDVEQALVDIREGSRSITKVQIKP